VLGLRWLSYANKSSKKSKGSKQGVTFRAMPTTSAKFSIHDLKQKWMSYQNMLHEKQQRVS
jgi:hypothetical protein